MNYAALFQSAIVALLRNKMRSIMTVLGITIGIAAPLSTIQSMLRHSKPQTTARYIHSVNSKQVEAQGKLLESIDVSRRFPISRKIRYPSIVFTRNATTFFSFWPIRTCFEGCSFLRYVIVYSVI